MDLTDVRFIEVSIKKKVEITYEDYRDGRVYEAIDEEISHPDFVNAIQNFKGDIARSYEKLEPDHFNIKTIQFKEVKEKTYLIIKGKMKTAHEDSVSVNSGEIPFVDDSALIEKIKILKDEAFKYLFHAKIAQGKLEFKE